MFQKSNAQYTLNREVINKKDETLEKIDNVYTLDDIWNLPPKEWILTEWFGKNDVGMIFGDSAAGKTFVAIDLMVSGMLEKRFANKFDFNERMKCLYVCGEGFRGAVDRIKASLQQHKLPEDIKQYFLATDVVPSLKDGDICQAFVDKFKDKGINLIVIDTLNIASDGANEDKSSEMGPILANAQEIARQLDAVVILIHHANKSGGYRGSTAIKASCDFMIEVSLSDNGNSRKMSCFKMKDGEKWSDIPFNIRGVDLLTGGRSAVVEWSEGKNADYTAKDAIRDYGKKNPGAYCSYKSIVNVLANKKSDTPLNENTVKAALIALSKEENPVWFVVEDESEKTENGFKSNQAIYRSMVF